jgi:secreted trypsin-like serine protease
VRLKLIAFGVFLAATLGFAIPASGITFGREVTNASTTYPSVVSIWYSPNASESPDFICSGTLIEPRVVLTAAHCVLSTGLYYVRYGADQLDEDIPALEVDATWKNPRYSERQGVNDVGLLLLTKPIQGAQVTPLSNKSTLQKVQASKSVKYEIVGWGKDQNSEDATYLRKAAVDDQTAFAKKIKAWAPWRNDVWFAVGKYNAKEKVFAGACNGDSGGPLFAYLNGTTYLAGVTSWGAEDCELGAPSVYVRLSYYIDEIKNLGIPQLYVNEVKQNRSKPSFTRLPKITGQAKVGSTISCDTGAVSSNTQEWTYYWTLNGSYISPTTESITLTPSNSSSVGREYICIVTAKNSNGSIVESVSVKQPPLPASMASSLISGVPSAASNTTSTATCTAAKFSNANSIQNEWWIGSSNFFAPTSKISNGNTITLDTNFYVNNGGRYLFCVSRASGDGGTSDSTSSGVYIPTFPKPSAATPPIVNNVPTVAFDGQVKVTCTSPSFINATKVSIDWLVGDIGFNATRTKVSSGSEIILSRESFQTWGGKNLFCRTIASGAGGVYELDSTGVRIPSFNKPIVQTYPKIEGIQSYVTPNLGTILTCPGVKWTGEVLKAETSWYSGTYGSFLSATKFITAESIEITEELIEKYGGKYLFCAVTATNHGGSTIADASAYLSSSFNRPSTDLVKISGGFGVTSGFVNTRIYPSYGDVLTCSHRALRSGEVAQIKWFYGSLSDLYDANKSSFTNTFFSGLLSLGKSFTFTKEAIASIKLPNGNAYTGGYMQLNCEVQITRGLSSTFEFTSVNFYSVATTAGGGTTQPTVIVAPSQPAITSIVPTTNAFTINWSVPTSNGGSPITQYWAYVENTSGTTVAFCSTTGALSCTATGLAPNTNYRVIVSAWNSAGGVNRSSGDQNSPRTSAMTTAATTDASTGLSCVLLKNGRIDSTTKKPCTELTGAGINQTNLALNQTITRSGNTFTTGQLFAPTPGDNYFVSWWISDTSYDKNNWIYTVMGNQVKVLQESHVGVTFTPTQSVLNNLKGKYLMVQVIYGYSRFNILEGNGLGVLAPYGIGSILIP